MSNTNTYELNDRFIIGCNLTKFKNRFFERHYKFQDDNESNESYSIFRYHFRTDEEKEVLNNMITFLEDNNVYFELTNYSMLKLMCLKIRYEDYLEISNWLKHSQLFN